MTDDYPRVISKDWGQWRILFSGVTRNAARSK